jgi:hypothetical protein
MLSICGTEYHSHLNHAFLWFLQGRHLGEEEDGDGVEADAQRIATLDQH